MSFANPSDHDEGVNEINMTPLVDVMLVLLIIFIVTIPVVKQSLEIDLPDVAGISTQQPSDTIEISVTASGEYVLDGQLINEEELKLKFIAIAKHHKNQVLDQIPAIQIHGDKQARYERIAQVLSLAQQSGFYKIGFVIDGAAVHDAN
jgi:biopolymer transport protein ExbD